MKFKNPRDIINKKLFSTMTAKEVNKKIKNTISKLNRRLKTLEKSGYDKYSLSYQRIKEYLTSNGSKYFSSKGVGTDFETRVDFLTKLSHFETYKIGKKETISQLKDERRRINERYNVNISEEQLLTVKDAMRSWRLYIGTSTIYGQFTSDEARELFTENADITQPQVDRFISQLSLFDDGTYSPEDFVIFRENYNFDRGIPIRTDNGVSYNPMNMRIYDNYYSETEYTYDDINDVVLLNNEPQNINSDGEIYSSYDFLNRKK